MKRVIQQPGVSLATIKTHVEKRISHESYSFFVDAMQLMGFSGTVKNRYFDTLKSQDGVVPSDAFNRAFPGFPFRLLAAPLSKSKDVVRLDHLAGRRGGELAALYLDLVAQNIEVADSVSIVMMIRLPYFKNIHCMHNVDPGFIKLWDQPGAIYSVKSESGHRINLQGGEFFFGNPVVKEIIHEYLGSLG